MRAFFSARQQTDAWPRPPIEAAIRRAFGAVTVIGDDQGHTIYEVEDGDLRFVIALVHHGSANAGVCEIGFLARFLRYPVSDKALRSLNSGLHLASAFIESGELYLIARIAATGSYDETRFGLMLEAWRRDMTFVMATLSGKKSAEAGPPELGFDAGRIKEQPTVFAMAYFWRNDPKTLCRRCRGRGRAGLFRRECDACEGKGFVGAFRASESAGAVRADGTR